MRSISSLSGYASSIANESIVSVIKDVSRSVSGYQATLGDAFPSVPASVIHYAARPFEQSNDRTPVAVLPFFLDKYSATMIGAERKSFMSPVPFHDVVSSLVRLAGVDDATDEEGVNNIIGRLNHMILENQRPGVQCVSLTCDTDGALQLSEAIRLVPYAALIGAHMLAVSAATPAVSGINREIDSRSLLGDSDLDNVLGYIDQTFRAATTAYLATIPAGMISQISSLYAYLTGRSKSVSFTENLATYAKPLALLSVNRLERLGALITERPESNV